MQRFLILAVSVLVLAGAAHRAQARTVSCGEVSVRQIAAWSPM